MPKIKQVKKYEAYHQREGTIQQKESLTDQSQQAEADINKCIEKYGITSLIQQSKAKEPLYLDMTKIPATVEEAMNQRKQIDEYFENLPAKARKAFGDSTEEFYQKYNRGEFENMIEYGILTKEQIMAIGGIENEKDLQDIINAESVSSNSN